MSCQISLPPLCKFVRSQHNLCHSEAAKYAAAVYHHGFFKEQVTHDEIFIKTIQMQCLLITRAGDHFHVDSGWFSNNLFLLSIIIITCPLSTLFKGLSGEVISFFFFNKAHSPPCSLATSLTTLLGSLLISVSWYLVLTHKKYPLSHLLATALNCLS